MLSDDLFVRLINHRISNTLSRKEDFLSEAFAWMLINDSALSVALLRENGPIFKDRSSNLTQIDSLDIKTQQALGNYGRVDLTLGNPQEGMLLIESKVDAPYDQEQIDRYLSWAQQNRAVVLAIIPQQQLNRLTTISSNTQFVGIRSWEEIGNFIEQLPNPSPPSTIFESLL